MKASKALQRGVWGWVFLFIISCIAISTFTASAGRLGDINSDGEIDSTDVTLLKRHLLRKNILTGTAYSNADTDGDRDVTSTDLTFLKRYVLRRISSFPGETADPTPSPTPSPSNNLNITWDWAGIIGTGQSLSVGSNPILSSTQPYNNLKLSLGNLRVPPYDANSSELKLVPLTEPIRNLAMGYPAPTQGTYMARPPILQWRTK